jgi:hypothetical protein
MKAAPSTMSHIKVRVMNVKRIRFPRLNVFADECVMEESFGESAILSSRLGKEQYTGQVER